MDQDRREVFKAHREAQGKYIYFILAAAGAGIALALNQTQTARLAWTQVPLAAAVISWALSFWCGCQHLSYVSSALYANHEMLRIQGGIHPATGKHPEMIAAGVDGIRSAIESNSEWANRHANWQFRLLLAGGVLYIGWHILEIHRRTVG